MRYWKVGLLAGACAACCAPLLAPLFVGSAFVGMGSAGLGAFVSFEAGMIALVVGLMGTWLFWQHKKPAPVVNANKNCGCASDAVCDTGNACGVPNRSAISAVQIPTP